MTPTFAPSSVTQLPFGRVVMRLIGRSRSLRSTEVTANAFMSRSGFLGHCFGGRLSVGSRRSRRASSARCGLMSSTLNRLDKLDSRFPSVRGTRNKKDGSAGIRSPGRPLTSATARPGSVSRPRAAISGRASSPGSG